MLEGITVYSGSLASAACRLMRFLLIVPFVFLTNVGWAASPGQCAHRDFALQLLGTGGPVSDDARASSSTVLWWKGKALLLFDIGGGAYLRFGQSGASLEDLAFIGLSHFHTDHVCDLPALLKGAVFSSRSGLLPVAGPAGSKAFPGLEDFLRRQFGDGEGAYSYLSGLLKDSGSSSGSSSGRGELRLERKELQYKDRSQVSKVYEGAGGLTVYAKSVPHGNVPTIAWRVEVGGRRIVLSPDQNGTDSEFPRFARDADLLIMPMALDESAGPRVTEDACPAEQSRGDCQRVWCQGAATESLYGQGLAAANGVLG